MCLLPLKLLGKDHILILYLPTKVNTYGTERVMENFVSNNCYKYRRAPEDVYRPMTCPPVWVLSDI